MNTNLQKKPFLDYQSQLNALSAKKLCIEDKDCAIQILQKTSYYGLINGYKDCFKDNSTHLFSEGTTFNDIYNLYLFDMDLRSVFLKYILIIERHVKSSISYYFTELYGNGMCFYQDYSNYDYGIHKADIQRLFNKMKGKLTGKQKSIQVAHYMNTYGDVPLWVLATDMTFGEISVMYRYLKGHCKTLVCNDFNGIGRAELGKMLIILTKFRNICAHGNRLFNARTQDAILDCTAHKKMGITKTNALYIYGKSDLFATVIALKYLLDVNDFRAFYYELKKIIKRYQVSDSTLRIMGFPGNWMSILRIKVY